MFATVGVVLVAGAGVGAALGLKGGGTSKPRPVVAVATQPSCQGAQLKLFDNTNTGGVQNGGRAPTFSTNGRPYCVTRIQTYHWNSGQGMPPGTVGLARVSGPSDGVAQVGPLGATSSSGQGNAPNVNWFADVGTSHPSVIDGTYRCTDSDSRTWSQNAQSQGNGFCIVYAVPAGSGTGGPGAGAAAAGGAGATTTTAPAPQSLKMGPIQANFVQAVFGTFYTVNPVELAALPVSYSWHLSLQLVDQAGAPNPGTPGSGAGVDAGCNNNGALSTTAKQFAWYHPDAANSNPPGAYHCDHSLMGPSGHEGLISVTVTDGKWVCTATYGGTNTGVGGPANCVPVPVPPPSGYVCQGPAVKLFDNTNGGAVQNGGRAPSFGTGGKVYCLTRIQTYHWNSGRGASPGSLGLTRTAGSGPGPGRVGPVPARASSGQNNAPNVNWFVDFGTGSPVLIDGTYQCSDSAPATWSTDGQAQGLGFCIVYGEPARPGP